jgi:O-antigen/teichoic acid export membrane protein
VLTLARGVLQAILSTALLAYGAGVTGIIAGGTIATLIEVVAILALILPETGLSLGPARLRSLMIYGLPILFAGCAAFTLGSLDRWMLADAVSASDLARYGVAAKISAVAATLVQPFNMWWTSKRFIVLNGPNGKQAIARNATIGIVIALLAAVVTALGGPLLILLLTPAEYHSAAAYVPWLVLAFAAQEVGTFLNTGCYDRADGFASLGINLAAAGLIVVLYLLLIPPFGVAGAIAATIGAQGARSLLYHAVSQRRVRLEYPGLRLTLLCIGCCIGVFGAYTGLQPVGAAVAAVPLAAALGLIALQMKLLPPLPVGGLRIGRRTDP